MFNFDVPRYEKVVGDAIALRPQIEKAVDEICKEGYSNIFFIGCGGTYAHSLPMKYWFNVQDSLFRIAVAEANASDADLVIFGGDLTNMGSDRELALDKGYTFSWGSDVSEIGFTRDGLAVVPDVNIKEMSDAEIAKWVKMPKTQQQAELLKKPGKEKEITQELRQQEFDNKLTTDDHGI